MDTITLFTTKYECPKLFGDFSSLTPIYNNELSSVLLKIFNLDKSCREVWEGLNLDDKKKVVIDVDPEYEKRIDKWIKRINEREDILNEVWEKEKLFVIGKSCGRWSIYESPSHKGVYALHCLNERREPKMWIENLIQICKAINPLVKNINLVVHDKDFGTPPYNEEKLYVFKNADYCSIEIKSLKETYLLDKVNIITFQHWNGEQIPKILNNSDAKIDIHKKIEEIVKEESKKNDRHNDKH